jgi:CBS domain-containing protein
VNHEFITFKTVHNQNELNPQGGFMSQKLRKIMVEKVVTIEPKASALQAAELMNMHEIGCIVVVDHEKPVGILTERDMLKRVICKSKSSKTVKVIDLMSKPLVSGSPDMRAGDAAKIMFERNIKKLPVVENGQLLGLVTLTDLLRSPGVVEFLNTISLDGTSNRIRKAAGLYYDPMKQHRRTCPLSMKEGTVMGCTNVKCMWWADDECAVTKLARQNPMEDMINANIAEESVCEDASNL